MIYKPLGVYPTKCPPPGVYLDIPHDEYLLIDAVSCSFLKECRHSLNFAYQRATRGVEFKEQKKCWDDGTLFHMMIGEPERVLERFIVKPEVYPDSKTGEDKPWNGNATYCKEWIKDNSDRIITDQKTIENTGAMAYSILSDPRFAEYLKGCKVEVTLIWKDPITGLPCKARLDLFKGAIVDLKSTSRRSNELFMYEAHNFGYDIQGPWYLWGGILLKIFGKNPPMFRFAVVENQFPYEVGFHDVTVDPKNMDFRENDIWTYGRLKFRELLFEISHAVDSGDWAGRPKDSMELVLAPSASKELEQMITDSIMPQANYDTENEDESDS